MLAFQLAFFRSFICVLYLTEMLKIRHITTANYVTTNDDEDTRVGKESRCNCLFLGRNRRRRSVEEVVTSELF